MPNNTDVLICTLDGTYAIITIKSGVSKWLQKLDSPIFATPNLLHASEQMVLAEVKGQIHICSWQSGKKVM